MCIQWQTKLARSIGLAVLLHPNFCSNCVSAPVCN